MSFKLPKWARLLNSREFFNTVKFGQERTGQFLRIYARTGQALSQKIGITVSRRFGKAHDRNRFKRQIREIFRLSRHDLPQNLHVNVFPLKEAKGSSFQSLSEEFKALLQNRG